MGTTAVCKLLLCAPSHAHLSTAAIVPALPSTQHCTDRVTVLSLWPAMHSDTVHL